MQTIFVMVKCELGRAYEVADEAVGIEQVSEVYSTSGEYDLLMKCYLPDTTDIGHFVTSKLQTLAGQRALAVGVDVGHFGRNVEALRVWQLLRTAADRLNRDLVAALHGEGRLQRRVEETPVAGRRRRSQVMMRHVPRTPAALLRAG